MSVQDLSNSMIRFGVSTVKKNPIKTSLYLLGLLLCLFFNGITVDEETVIEYENGVKEMAKNWVAIDDAREQVYDANVLYRNSMGWFWSCDEK